MQEGQLIFDRYLILGHAGAGGMASVWHARDKLLNRDVAIKCIELSPEDAQKASSAAGSAPRGKHAAGAVGAGAAAAGDGAAEVAAQNGEGAAPARGARAAGADAAVVAQQNAVGGSSAIPNFPKDPTFLDRRDQYIKWQKAVSYPAPAVEDIPPWVDPAEAEAEAAAGSPICGTAANGAWEHDLRDGTSRRQSREDRVTGGPSCGPYSGVDGEGADAAGQPACGYEAQDGCGAGRAFATSDEGQEARADAQIDGNAFAKNEENPSSNTESVLDSIDGVSEARSVARLNDGNIVTVYDCVVEGGFAYVIMEYVEGLTLAAIMERLDNNITLDMIAAVFGAVSHALEVAHEENMLHLDIKPENVIVNAKGQVKVTDFGLATLMDSSGHGRAGGGTIGYMPPEQINQEKLDVRTDEWALASLLYEMLSGTKPFKARNLPAALVAIENAELVLPSACWAEIDEAIDDAVFMALDPDPEERFPSVMAFSKAVAPCLGSAKAGAAQLSALVQSDGEGADEEEEQVPFEPGVPFIDWLGPKGAGVLMRVFAVFGCVFGVAVATVNVRLQSADMWGMLSWCWPAFWVMLVAAGVFAALRPRWACLVPAVAFVAALAFNHAWVPAVVFALLAGVWWWFCARRDNVVATLGCLQPMFGSVGAGTLVPAIAGALLDVRQAVGAAAGAVLWSVALGTFGSGALGGWDVVRNLSLPASAALAAEQINGAALAMLTDPQTWIIAASWVFAAFTYSAFCRKGKRAFDIAGACIAAVVLVGAAAVASVAFAGAINWSQTLMAALCAGIGIAFAIMRIPDRVRMEEGEW